MTERHEVILTGCNPTPLASYLKGLGVLSVIADQVDRQITARWSGNTFVLRSILDRSDLREFFLYRYMPTPIISPWNGRAGFLEGEDGSDSTRKGAVIINEIINSRGDRFKSYRTTLKQVKDNNVISDLNKARIELKKEDQRQKDLKNMGQQITDEDKENLNELKRKEKNLKNLLSLSLRSESDERFLSWFDACMALAGNESLMAPLLGGAGGNEGSMDFSINHLGHLKQLIDPATDQPTEVCKSSINHALFDNTTVVPLKKAQGNPGFFSPGVTGGYNMSNGYEGYSRDNPWNTVLMLEGTVLFASTITKRHNLSEDKFLSFPFMFEAFQAGDGSIYTKEKNRPEFWAPLWDQFATITELRSLISEGRCTVMRQAVNHGLDMLRAVKSLGVDRSIKAFQRFGFFKRRGDSYVTTPIGRFSVGYNETNTLIKDFHHNNWLSDFHKFTNGKNVADRFVSLQRKLDEQLLLVANRHPSPADVQDILISLGEIQGELTHSTKAREKVSPIPQLSEKWVLMADDRSTAFRIARALAGLRGVDTKSLPLRSQLFSIHHANRNEWLERVCKDNKDKKHKDDPACCIRLHISPQRDLTTLLIALLQQRLSLPSRLDFKDKPLNSAAGVDLADLSAFLTNYSMDFSIAALLPGLSLCKIPESEERKAGKGEIHAAYALCKLALTPDVTLRSLGVLGREQNLPVAPQLVPKLAAGNNRQAKHAIEIAWRRLRGSGLDSVIPSNQLPDLAGVDPRRLAAALLIPLNYGACGALVRFALKNEDPI